MQTILGSNGQVGQELAKVLHDTYTKDIRLVSRNPQKINDSDQLHPANLLDFKETEKAIAGSEIVYFTVGLPMDSSMWEQQFPIILNNVLEACKKYQSKFVYFDNTYMYAKNAHVQTETSPFVPVGRKSIVRAKMADLVQAEILTGDLEAVICRAPEFYGPDKTQSITNHMIFNHIKQDKRAKVPVSEQTLRTLIWTPDASRAMALIANSADCYGQTYHLPCAEPITYQELLALIHHTTGQKPAYTVIPLWQFKLGRYFNKELRELQELLPRYQFDNVFLSTKFSQRFPEFKVTSFESGVAQLFEK